MNSLNILALDPAAKTGWAWSDGIRRHSGTWTLEPKRREMSLRNLILGKCEELPTDVIAYELAGFGSHNPAVKAAHDRLAGVIVAAAQDLGLKCWGFGIGTWKRIALGKGNAKKPDVVRLLKIHHGITVSDFDEADSIGILIAALAGPPPASKKKQAKRVAKAIKARQPTLFRVK